MLSSLVDARDELVLDDSAVLLPVLAVLSGAFLKVSSASMGQDGQEEDGVEHGDDGVEPSGQPPRQGLTPVGGVVDLSRVDPPSVNQQLVAVLGLDVLWLFDLRTGNDREGVSGLVLALLLHLEGRLLGHRSVENAVSSDKSDKHEDLAHERELVGRGGASSHVDDGVTVGEGSESLAAVKIWLELQLTLPPCSRR